MNVSHTVHQEVGTENNGPSVSDHYYIDVRRIFVTGHYPQNDTDKDFLYFPLSPRLSPPPSLCESLSRLPPSLLLTDNP